MSASPSLTCSQKSLIDMYSEVLDELSDLDSAYNAQDQLPRVVVVGDQSSGKTSVLEMIAQARIFPRGGGEMMTRSPVKVTLSEGPYHVASFKDGSREYDLTKESELASLRKEIEVSDMRMKALVSGGKTVSTDVISLNVKGPGLQRMVLVDLPGIISTVTTGMQSGTRETIQDVARQYMSNPNAIILCVQDGSIDAERSNVTDLVSSVDPSGKRTIFVLTKVDLAESNLHSPDRIRQILEGKLFPMKALGYFAVVTGKGTKDESIDSIKEYEENFFRHSRLFKEGTLRMSQMTTANLSKAVSERFWKMVKDSVEQQADTYRAIRYNLETEWKNLFPHLREMDREELFEKARNNILDDLISLNGISSTVWEKNIHYELWNKLKDYIFTKIIEPSQHIDDIGTFQTNVDIWLRDWVENKLPKASIETGLQTLYNQLDSKLKTMQDVPGYDPVFDPLKEAVHQEIRKRHHWDPKAESRLRVIQSNALDDHTVHTKSQWTAAVDLLEQAVKARLKDVNQSITSSFGPGWVEQWTRWRKRTAEQDARLQTAQEIENLLISLPKPSAHINQDDLTTIRRNLQARNVPVTDKIMKEFLHRYASVWSITGDALGKLHNQFDRDLTELTTDRLLNILVTERGTGTSEPQGVQFEDAEVAAAFSSNATERANGITANGVRALEAFFAREARAASALANFNFVYFQMLRCCQVRETWEPLVQRFYLERSLFACQECRKGFYYYQHGFLNTSFNKSSNANEQISNAAEHSRLRKDSLSSDFPDCREVILFSRLNRMMNATSNALRQQIMNDEARRLEHYVKQALNELSNDPIRVKKLITGKRVQLAEDLTDKTYSREIRRVHCSFKSKRITVIMISVSPKLLSVILKTLCTHAHTFGFIM
ncbi:optic atrophy 1-like protein, opa1 [Schistosoma mansoni]|uniref:optic atrophy 1-like protein, opa1 n=1 Tax=Schistosoma mansoni TaxID=6183 RepID=UPI00022DC13D|nr:optic atrophy 1-like protein, opa1 [Schistosoma mansoni]|eukprot:XP_018648577.1 optic atrophy 1-like protein, opa1 [Schistosoma mansoni]